MFLDKIKKTNLVYIFYLLGVSFLFLILAEAYFSYADYKGKLEANNPNAEKMNAEQVWDYSRHIRLREQKALINEEIMPNKSRLIEGSLEKKLYKFRTDGEGFIEPSIIHQDPDLTMVFMGGSTTECLFVDEDKRFPYLAGKLIAEETGMKINSINSGRSMNHVIHNLNILINKMIPFKLDYVFLMNNINDLYIMQGGDKSYWNEHPIRSLLIHKTQKEKQDYFVAIKGYIKKLIPHTYLRLQELKHKIKPPKENNEIDQEFNFKEYASEFEKALTSFVRVCKSYNFKTVLMTQASRFTEVPSYPYSNEKISYSDYRKAHRLFNETIRNVAAREKVGLIDLEQQIPQTKEYMYDVMHLNNSGSVLVAQKISEYMIQLEK